MRAPRPTGLDRWLIVPAMAACLLTDAVLLVPQFRDAGFRPDFSVFWTAARVAAQHPELLYDFDAMTRAQAWIADPAIGSRPFLYPPTALLLFAPVRLLSFPLAFAAWTMVSLAAFWSILRRVPRDAAWLALIAPPVVQAVMTGQTTLIVGAMIARGLDELDRRPVVAGLWLGAAAAIKPQTVLMLPVAYARTRQWRALGGSAVAGLAMLVAALPFGPDLWIDWLQALPRYSTVMASVGQNMTAISPASAAAEAGLGPLATALLRIAGAAGGAGLVWWAFGQPAWHLRLTALLCGAFLASPYAMPYELAVLSPIAAMLLLHRGYTRWLAMLPLTGLGGVVAVLSLVASMVVWNVDRRTAKA